jgi:hypothetical protein
MEDLDPFERFQLIAAKIQNSELPKHTIEILSKKI